MTYAFGLGVDFSQHFYFCILYEKKFFLLSCKKKKKKKKNSFLTRNEKALFPSDGSFCSDKNLNPLMISVIQRLELVHRLKRFGSTVPENRPVHTLIIGCSLVLDRPMYTIFLRKFFSLLRFRFISYAWYLLERNLDIGIPQTIPASKLESGDSAEISQLLS